MKILYSILLSLLITTVCQAKVWTLNEILEATCRVKAGSSYGSGTCFKHEGGRYYILTNAHVVGNNRTVSLEFFKNGHKTLPIPATVVFKKLIPRSDIDFSIVAVKDTYFGNYPPRVAQVAPRGARAKNNYMKSAGCPSARWAAAWEGTIKEKKGGRILFYPPPIGGQSGSGLYIVNNGNTLLKGVVTWRVGQSGRDGRTGYERATGAAINIDRLYDTIAGRVEFNTIPSNYEVVNCVKTPIQNRSGAYGYGNDCRFYPIVNGYITKPNHVQIIAYHITKPQNIVECDVHGWHQVQCPDGACQPFFRRNPGPSPSPDNPYPGILPIPPRNGVPTPGSGTKPNAPGNRTPNNPYDFLPDRDDELEPTPVEPETPPVNPLQKELDAIQVEKDNLVKELQSANTTIKQNTDDIAKLNKKINEAKGLSSRLAADYASLTHDKVQTRLQNDKLKVEIEQKQSEIQALIDESALTKKQIAVLGDNEQNLYAQTLKDKKELEQKQIAIENRNEIIDAQVESELAQKDKVVKLEKQNSYFTTGTGVFGIGALLFLIRNFYTTARRNKVKNQVDRVQNIIEDKITDVAGETIGDVVRNAMEVFESRVSNKIDGLKGHVDEEIQYIHQKIEKDTAPSSTITYNHTLPPMTSTIPPITNTLEQTSDGPILDAIDGVYNILGKIQEDIKNKSNRRSSKKKTEDV